MPLRIFINDKEFKSPVIKYGLAIAVFIGAIVTAAFIVYILLPIIGITIAATLGLLIVIAVGLFAAAVALTLGSAILATIIVLVEYIVSKFRRH